MTRIDLRSLRAVFTVFVVGFAVTLVGCASLGPVTPVAVSDIKTVAGTWRGTLYQSGLAPDQVKLTIREDGSYDVVSTLPVGTSRGHGKIVISDGRLIFEGEKGRGVGTLRKNAAGALVLDVDATLTDNSIVSARLYPSS